MGLRVQQPPAPASTFHRHPAALHLHDLAHAGPEAGVMWRAGGRNGHPRIHGSQEGHQAAKAGQQPFPAAATAASTVGRHGNSA